MMYRVIKYDVVRKEENGKSKTFWQLRVRDKWNENAPEKIIEIRIRDVPKITDDSKSYPCNNGEETFVPREIWDFDLYYSKLVRTMFEKGMLDALDYSDLCWKRIDNYRVYKYSNIRICKTFFYSYLPLSVIKQYKDPFEMFDNHNDFLWNAELHKIVDITETVIHEGKFIGCYYDDQYRKNRPLTSRKWTETCINRIWALKICAYRELIAI